MLPRVCMYIYIHIRLYVQWKVPVYQPEIITDIDQKWIGHIFPWSHCIPMSIPLKCILPLYSIILHLVRILLYSHEIPMKTPLLPHLARLGVPNAWLSSCSWECWNSATDHRLSMEFFHLPSDNQRWQWNNHCKCSFLKKNNIYLNGKCSIVRFDYQRVPSQKKWQRDLNQPPPTKNENNSRKAWNQLWREHVVIYMLFRDLYNFSCGLGQWKRI